jgi:AcrR family transcriptional regulator
MTRQAEPVTLPATEAQLARYARVVAAATALLTAGGADALQMKDLAQRAEVSLDTLYRYFPSKEHVLAAIGVDRYERAHRKALAGRQRGETVRERVTEYLLREFRTGQRNEKLTAALFRVRHGTSRGYSEVLERLYHRHIDILLVVAGDSVTERQRRVLPVVTQIFGSAVSGWLSGIFSAADARFEIRIGCRLLDLPDAVIREDSEQARSTGR